VGVNALGGYKDRQAAEQQAKFGEQMKKMWVQNNPVEAYKYAVQAPGMLGIKDYLSKDILNQVKQKTAYRKGPLH
jgi:hypothetical protein